MPCRATRCAVVVASFARAVDTLYTHRRLHGAPWHIWHAWHGRERTERGRAGGPAKANRGARARPGFCRAPGRHCPGARSAAHAEPRHAPAGRRPPATRPHAAPFHAAPFTASRLVSPWQRELCGCRRPDRAAPCSALVCWCCASPKGNVSAPLHAR